MNMQTLQLACVIAIVLCLGLALVCDDAAAQSGDQKIAQQKGLGTKEIDKDRLPGKMEVGLAVGSAVLAFGVFKWL